MFDGNLNINYKTLTIQSCLLLLDSEGKIVLSNPNDFKLLGDGFTDYEQKVIFEKLQAIQTSNTSCFETQFLDNNMALVIETLKWNEHPYYIVKFKKNIPKAKTFCLANRNNQITPLPTKKRKTQEIPKQKTIFPEIPTSLSSDRQQLLSLASHEFMNPLSGISTSADLILKYSKLENHEQVHKHVKVIQSLTRHLTHIMNDFINMEKMDFGKLEINKTVFDFNILINEIIENCKTLLQTGQKIEYKLCKTCIVLYQDRKMLDVILTNLLYNAIKYSPENTSIKIVVKSDQNISIKIIDCGIGIPLEEQKYIFNRFFRASNVEHIPGTGIGLNIVKLHLDEIGGAIRFKSKLNQGTTFTVHIPINNPN